MKRMLVAGAISALALIGAPAAASAAPADLSSPGCFGQIHKAINTEGLLDFGNVGNAVKAVGGQAKNETARAACAG